MSGKKKSKKKSKKGGKKGPESARAEKAGKAVRPGKDKSAVKSSSLRLSEKIKDYRPPEIFLENLDLVLAGIFFVIIFIIVIPPIRLGFDREHHTTLLMASLRVLDGQIPYRDFFPWYGPLYYYVLGPLVWISGSSLLSVKLYLKVFAPLISMVMFILSLRGFRILWQGRAMAVGACALWGAERLFHCGSTRSMLGLLLIALWVSLTRSTKSFWPRLIVFPSILIAVFYSPEVGIYLILPALAVATLDLINLPGRERKKALLFHAGGAAVAVALIAGLYFCTTFAKNYLDFMSYASTNTHWAYGRIMPEFSDMIEEPRRFLYFLPIVVIMTSGIDLLIRIKREGINSIQAWVPACMLYGIFLYGTIYLRVSDDHLLFAIPPILALLGLFFARKSRFGWIKLLMIALFIWGTPFFPNSWRFDMGFFKTRFNPEINWKNRPTFMGLYSNNAVINMIGQIKKFSEEHADQTILFPLHGFEAFRAGRPFVWSFDDLFWINYPPRRKRLIEEFNNLNPDYICLDHTYFNYVYMHEDTDEFFDLMASRYVPVKVILSTIIYKRSGEAMYPARLVSTLKGPFYLKGDNEYSYEWDVPAGVSQGYVEMNEKFFFSPEFLRRLSCPFVEFYVDDKPQEWDKPRGSHGREHLRTTLGGGTVRIYLPLDTEKVKIELVFKGMFNAKPDKVEITDVRFFQFNYKPQVPYTNMFLKHGY
jgi:hypothetical protein